MKTFFFLCLLCQLMFLPIVTPAQTVIQGDSVYQGLQPEKATQSDVMRVLGTPDSIKESRSFFHVLLRGGGDGHGMRLDGYSFNYPRRYAKVILDMEKARVDAIHFGPKSNIITAYGIQPTKSTFADVVKNYATINATPEPHGFPINVKATKHYTYLRYQRITFISYGHWKSLDELLTKPVDEIWLH